MAYLPHVFGLSAELFFYDLESFLTESDPNTLYLQQLPHRNNTFAWVWMAQALGDVLFKIK